MRYFYEKPRLYFQIYGETYRCSHEVYDTCTLYRIGNAGLAVIQQRFDPKTKTTYWTEIDPWLVDDIYLHPKFRDLLLSRASRPQNDIFPTITVRQLMWALKMKPLPKERWETVFDRKDI